MDKNKITTALLTAVQTAEQSEHKYAALKATAFDSMDDYTTYCYDVATLSDKLYVYQTTHDNNRVLKSQLNHVLATWFNIDKTQAEAFIDIVLRGGLVTAVKPSQNLVEEDTLRRATLQELIKAAEDKPLDESYTAARRAEAVEAAKQNLRDFMKTARYEGTIASPTRYNPFKRRFEEVFGKTLNDSLRVKEALHAVHLDKYREMYGRWAAAAIMYGINPTPYIETENIHGLKAAVREAKTVKEEEAAK